MEASNFSKFRTTDVEFVYLLHNCSCINLTLDIPESRLAASGFEIRHVQVDYVLGFVFLANLWFSWGGTGFHLTCCSSKRRDKSQG